MSGGTDQRAVSSLSGKAVTPGALLLSETLYVAQGVVKVMLTATCQRVGGARYLWSWRRDERVNSNLRLPASTKARG